MRTFFKKLECEFLVESTKTENATFTYKTALSYPTVKTNRMARTKWANRKERIFVTNNFFFFLKKILFFLIILSFSFYKAFYNNTNTILVINKK